MRSTFNVDGTPEELAELIFKEPVRLSFASPSKGGPALGVLRTAFSPKGRVRFSGTRSRTFVDLDPGPPETPLVALETIARSDAAGLERMLLSVLPHVDEIVLGVDGRSDEETFRVAQRYADSYYVFEATDIGMRIADWNPSEKNPRGKIDFAAARNIGRSRVQAPWTLVIDSDEYLQKTVDLRALVAGAVDLQGTFAPSVAIVDENGAEGFAQRDFQRLARTRYRWVSASHNQLIVLDSLVPIEIDTTIIVDTTVRAVADQKARDAQRDAAIEEMAAQAEQGNLNALFHVAKHKISVGTIEEATKYAESFRLHCAPNGLIAHQRQWVAITLARRFYVNENDFVEANRWACRALLDGPSVAAFATLGDIAEEEGDLRRALNWYEAACAVTDRTEITWPGVSEMRFGRLAGIRQALANPWAAPTIDLAGSAD